MRRFDFFRFKNFNRFNKHKFNFVHSRFINFFGLTAVSIIAIQQYLLFQNSFNQKSLEDQLKDNDLLNRIKFYQLITSVVAERDDEQLRDTLIVGLANGRKPPITMYGRHVSKDPSIASIESVSGRQSYDLHPYGKTGSGVTVTILDKDNRVLLGRKQNSDQWILLGGYMKPHPLLDGMPQTELNQEEMDRAEEKILSGNDINTSYQMTNPTTSKQGLLYDSDLKETAIREAFEEAKLDDNELKKYAEIFSISTRSGYNITNSPKLHTIVEDWVFRFKSITPSVQPGSDISELKWLPLEALRKNNDLARQNFGSKKTRYNIIHDGSTYLLRDDHGDVLGKLKVIIDQRTGLDSDHQQEPLVNTTTDARCKIL